MFKFISNLLGKGLDTNKQWGYLIHDLVSEWLQKSKSLRAIITIVMLFIVLGISIVGIRDVYLHGFTIYTAPFLSLISGLAYLMFRDYCNKYRKEEQIEPDPFPLKQIESVVGNVINTATGTTTENK